ncbi:MAG: sodium/proton antiporter NhaB [Nitrospira sp.]|nr:sodium/proton antiporter NhaB [Nitrospira sp.]HBP88231.1 sodium/proton antiporter NhaB [Nitrospiraceae bacterium]HNP30369.1 sodium/proton antiporter NhaB [Nitrospirales bacterium]
MAFPFLRAFEQNFLDHAPRWYKATILAFLIINPCLLYTVGPFVTGWSLVLEFIFTLAMALKSYPLQPGGLLALEAVLIGLAKPATVYHEALNNFQVILLLIFMVAGIYFMKDLLLFIFAKILLEVRSKTKLSLLFAGMGAFLSAFLDALTVTAVIIAVGVGFFKVYHRVASGKGIQDDYDHTMDQEVGTLHRSNLEEFRGFLRNLLMHGAVGTALGGVCTLVGEPQNLLIGEKAGWHFIEFFIRMSPVTIPVLAVGFLTCALVERFRWFGYGFSLPPAVRDILLRFDEETSRKMDHRLKARLIVQGLAMIWLIVALAFHLAEVGIIGLSVIVGVTAFNGIIEEHQLGEAFKEALPFTALLVVFFSVVAVIQEQQLFGGIIHYVLAMDGDHQIGMFFIANGILSAISDNVFVATIYIEQVLRAFHQGVISRDQFDLLAVAINTGTNIPSVATPNGQAAFLFLLTSALAPLIRLSYGRMVWMALPYTVTMTLGGLLAVYVLLQPITQTYYAQGILSHHVPVVAEHHEAQGIPVSLAGSHLSK